MLIVEHTLRTIRENETSDNLAKGAKALYDDYQKDKDLTAFVALDIEAFYETR